MTERNDGPLRKGERVVIRPEFQDAGDDSFEWYVVDCEEKGRVTVAVTIPGMAFPKVEVVQSYMVERAA